MTLNIKYSEVNPLLEAIVIYQHSLAYLSQDEKDICEKLKALSNLELKLLKIADGGVGH